MKVGTLGSACFATVCAGIIYGALATYRHRARVAQWQKQGVRMVPGWSWIFGHLGVMARATAKLPPDLNVLLIIPTIFDESDDTKHHNFLFDIWPMSYQVINLTTPEGASQAFANHRLPKSELVRKGMNVLAGGANMLTMSVEEWKPWRSVFNPGFSNVSMNAQVGVLVDKVEIFCRLLEERAGRNVFPLGDLTSRLTADVIVKLTLGLDINHQREEHPLIQAYNTILRWSSFWDPRILLNPFRVLIQGHYGRVMNRIIQNRLDELFAEMQKDGDGVTSSNTPLTQSIADLALRAYMKENASKGSSPPATGLDPVFRQYATYQARIFLLAGNDTTSTTLMFIFHLLHKNPGCLKLMREEHDRVLGTSGAEEAAARIREDPAVLNKLQYTTAVAKETMRIYPAGGASRHGAPGITIEDEDGSFLPTDDCTITSCHHAIHNNPRFWPRVEEFLPERWMVEPGHELYPGNVAAWRPFEHGPRNCIGQTLVWNEIRVVLALTARTFNITPAYEEWDAAKELEEGFLRRMAKSLGLVNTIKTYKGERAYMTDSAASRPSEGYPCRVELA